MQDCYLFLKKMAQQELKGKYHANLLSFQNPKMFVCQQKQWNNCQVCYKLSPQCNKIVDFLRWGLKISIVFNLPLDPKIFCLQ